MLVTSPFIAAEYSAFLRRLGIDDTDRPEEADDFTMSPYLIAASLGNRLGQLNDVEIAEFYSSTGVKNFLLVTTLSEKVAQFTALSLAMPETASSVIEFGGGPGLLSVFLGKQLGWRMTNLDVCREYLDYCEQLAAKEGIRVRTIQSFANDTPLQDDSYDLALCIDLIDCSENWRQIVREMGRVGRRVIIVYCTVSRFRRITPDEVIAELEQQGMQAKSTIMNPAHFIGGEDTGARWAIISGDREW